MSAGELLLDAKKAVDAALAECNRIARELMNEAAAFTGKDVERVLNADCDRAMSKAMDLVDARAKLALARGEFDRLKRRA